MNSVHDGVALIDRYKVVSDWLYYFLLLPSLSVLPVGWGLALARRQGRRFYRIHDLPRQRILDSLRRALAFTRSEQTADTARLSFELMAADDLDGWYFPFWSGRNLSKYFSFEGLEHLNALRKQGRGAVLVSGHIGAVASAMMALGLKGYRQYPLGHDMKEDQAAPAPLRAFAKWKVGWLKRRIGGRFLFFQLGRHSRAQAKAAIEAYLLLKKGQLIVALLDIPPHLVENTEKAIFLEKLCRFPSGAVRLAHMAEVPLVPFFIVRGESDWKRQRIIVQKPVEQTGDLKTDLQTCIDRIEAVIRRYPAHWFVWDSLTHFEIDAEETTLVPDSNNESGRLTTTG